MASRVARCRIAREARVVTIRATHPTSGGDVACGARWRVGVSRIARLYRDMHRTRLAGHRAARAVEITVDPQLRHVVPFGVRLWNGAAVIAA